MRVMVFHTPDTSGEKVEIGRKNRSRFPKFQPSIFKYPTLNKSTKTTAEMCDEARCQWLRGTRQEVEKGSQKGPVMYWMWRDKRVQDNWALIRAKDLAEKAGVGLAVVFIVKPNYMSWRWRHYHFLMEGLKQVGRELKGMNIPFYVKVSDHPSKKVLEMTSDMKARALVTDFLPLRDKMKWDSEIVSGVKVPFVRCDAHNIVPVWEASQKLEYAARTIRPKIMNQLDTYLTGYPELEVLPKDNAKDAPENDFAGITEELKGLLDKKVMELGPVDERFPPGPDGAQKTLSKFLTKKRLGQFDTLRNNPNHDDVLSSLSPYLNFGFMSPQRAVYEAKKYAKGNGIPSGAIASYVEEAVVRRELSDNFCLYNLNNYDKMSVAYKWARDTLKDHAKDKRDYVYTYEEFATSKTHDDLWNAAQIQAVKEGKIHGFLRMYWCKKILEWTESPEQALDFALRLNDEFNLDGNDPNGVVGVAWSILGIHDQGWREREVFGKIRFMNYAGCKRKFDVPAFVKRYNATVHDKKRKITDMMTPKKKTKKEP